MGFTSHLEAPPNETLTIMCVGQERRFVQKKESTHETERRKEEEEEK
jgi:hypothetical protein